MTQHDDYVHPAPPREYAADKTWLTDHQAPGPLIDSTAAATPVPKIWTTFWITLLFGWFGLIPTINHSNQARKLGKSTNKYWWTFVLTMVGILLVWSIVFAVASVPTYHY